MHSGDSPNDFVNLKLTKGELVSLLMAVDLVKKTPSMRHRLVAAIRAEVPEKAEIVTFEAVTDLVDLLDRALPMEGALSELRGDDDEGFLTIRYLYNVGFHLIALLAVVIEDVRKRFPDGTAVLSSTAKKVEESLITFLTTKDTPIPSDRVLH